MDCVDPNSDLKEVDQGDIYKKAILEHYKHPHNYKSLIIFSHKFADSNRICGDQVTIYLFVENGKIKDATFQGEGCALSIASSSMLTNKLKGMTLNEVESLTKQDILDMLGIKALLPSRMKCAMLALNAIQRGLAE